MNNACEYIDLTLQGYKFTIIKDERGTRLGSAENLKNLSYDELNLYRLALEELASEMRKVSDNLDESDVLNNAVIRTVECFLGGERFVEALDTACKVFKLSSIERTTVAEACGYIISTIL